LSPSVVCRGNGPSQPCASPPSCRSPASHAQRLQVYRDTLSLSSHSVSKPRVAYTGAVPKLWNKTIEAHRREVGDAILDTTANLVAKHGLRSVTMSQIADETGIGRATLYKYFADVEAILFAWHQRLVAGHLEHLAELRHQGGDAGDRLKTVLEAFA